MLASLTVRDIVLIEKAELSFGPGLNVLTGETGAGKSILLDALGLATGGRATGLRPGVGLRPGAGQGAASAIFTVEPGHAVLALLDENGLGTDSVSGGADEIILRRVVFADGRTRAFVNDSATGVALARAFGACLLEMHGQADDRGLFDNATHRGLLDAFGGHVALAAKVAALHRAHAAAAGRLDALARARDAASTEIDFLSFAADELAQLAPEEGEEERLASERALLMNAGRIAESLAAAVNFISGDGGAELTLAGALRRLSRMAAEGRQAASVAETALDSALALTQEAKRELDLILARLEADPGRLEAAEERLFGLRAAARKYHVPVGKLAGLRAEFEQKLALLDEGKASVAAAEQDAVRTRAAFLEAGRELSGGRKDAAKRLERAVAKELAPLKLGAARFRVALAALDETEASAGGLERVVFEVETIEGAGFGSLAKVASGGELSRFALALKVALAEASPPTVLVFDEIDRGVGGAVADAVGQRLQRLARTTQILLVTHSPQVAARGSRHFRISRLGDAMRVEALSDAARVEEIARMLAGATVTDEARAAAKRLLAEAVEPEAPKKRARA